MEPNQKRQTCRFYALNNANFRNARSGEQTTAFAMSEWLNDSKTKSNEINSRSRKFFQVKCKCDGPKCNAYAHSDYCNFFAQENLSDKLKTSTERQRYGRRKKEIHIGKPIPNSRKWVTMCVPYLVLVIFFTRLSAAVCKSFKLLNAIAWFGLAHFLIQIINYMPFKLIFKQDKWMTIMDFYFHLLISLCVGCCFARSLLILNTKYSTIQLLRVSGHISFSSDALHKSSRFFPFRLYDVVVVVAVNFASFLHCLR